MSLIKKFATATALFAAIAMAGVQAGAEEVQMASSAEMAGYKIDYRSITLRQATHFYTDEQLKMLLPEGSAARICGALDMARDAFEHAGWKKEIYINNENQHGVYKDLFNKYGCSSFLDSSAPEDQQRDFNDYIINALEDDAPYHFKSAFKNEWKYGSDSTCARLALTDDTLARLGKTIYDSQFLNQQRADQEEKDFTEEWDKRKCDQYGYLLQVRDIPMPIN